MEYNNNSLSPLEGIVPERLGISSATIINFAKRAEQLGIQVHSLMILRHGEKAAELWWKPYAPDIPHHLYSFSKSITATAIGFALSEGRLSLDDRIVKFFPRRAQDNADDRIFSVTVEHLLTMTSGAVMANEAVMQTQADWVSWFLNAPLAHFPGERFIYNSLNSYMLSAIIRQVTGMGLTDYLDERLFKPLGIPKPEWTHCPMGIECGGWGLSLTTESMARFCRLYLDDGMWEGRRVLPEGWAKLVGTKQVESFGDDKFSDNKNSTSGYGYHFWLNCDGKSYRADGMLGQYGIILPEKDTVIVTTAGNLDQMQLLDLIFEDIVPYIDAVPEGTEPGVPYEELCRLSERLELPKPKAIERQYGIEREFIGRTFHFPVNYFSMLPLMIRYLNDIIPLGIDELRFDFSEDERGESCLYWHEDGVTHSVPFTLDGRYTFGELCYGGHTLHTAVCAGWISEDTLEIDIRMIRTPHSLRGFFRFGEDTVTFYNDEDPSIEYSTKFVLDLIRIVRPMSGRIARFAGKLITPELTGRLAE